MTNEELDRMLAQRQQNWISREYTPKQLQVEKEIAEAAQWLFSTRVIFTDPRTPPKFQTTEEADDWMFMRAAASKFSLYA